LPGRSCLFASKRRGTPRRFSFTIICKKSYLKLFGGFRHHSFPILSLLNRIADPPDPERESLSTNNLDMNFWSQSPLNTKGPLCYTSANSNGKYLHVTSGNLYS
jgi:hypothetical protein